MVCLVGMVVILPPATSPIQSAIGLYIHGLVLKRHLATLPSPFHDADREWYNGKSIEHLHLYTYEVTSRHHHYIYQLVGVTTALALRRFIRTIFTPFLYNFYPHISPACDVQAGGFD